MENDDDDLLYLSTVHSDLAQMFMFDALVCALHHAGTLPIDAFRGYLDKSEVALGRVTPESLAMFRRNREHLEGLLRRIEAQRTEPPK